MTTLREALAVAVQRLTAAGVADADREAMWLLAHELETSAGSLRLRGHEVLSPVAEEAFSELVRRRAAREPLQYILGTEEFLGMTFRVSQAVLIPRLDTETLVRVAAARLHQCARVADIGTGSGAIAVGLARLVSEARVVAVDISPDALALARENAEANCLGDRIDFRMGDLLEPLGDERFDAILSNPPYIAEGEWAELAPEVRDFEPKGALTPGGDALVFYRRLAADAPARLRPGGFLAVEVGYDQARQVKELFAAAGLCVSLHQDTAGIDRVVVGQRA